MSGRVGLDVSAVYADAMPFESPSGQLPGLYRLVHLPGIDPEDGRRFSDSHQVTFTAHTSSMYLIPRP